VTEPNVEQAVPFFMVTNMEASLRFYVDGLGFEMTKKWTPRGKIEWCWLQLGGAALMLQEFGKDRVPEGKLGLGFSVCFQCRDPWRCITASNREEFRPRILSSETTCG
jgi:lactoylglutathione lyase